jgi:hypothetical protein
MHNMTVTRNEASCTGEPVSKSEVVEINNWLQLELKMKLKKKFIFYLFSPTIPPSAAGISRVVADVGAPGGESGNV